MNQNNKKKQKIQLNGTKATKSGVNKGAPVGTDLKNKVTVNATSKGKDNVVEGKKELDSESEENKTAKKELTKEINKEDDLNKEEKLREEQKGATTEEHTAVVTNPLTGEKETITTATTKDANTNTNKNVVKEEPKDAPAPTELTSMDGVKIEINNVKDVENAEETKTPVVEDKKEENTTKGIQSMFADEEDIKEDSKEFSKQVKEEAVKEDKKEDNKGETEATVVETKVVLPVVESTEEETAKVVAEEKTVEPTKSAPKAEVVEAKKEVKQQNKITEEKVEEVKTNATYADTVVAVSRDAKATFVVTSGKVVSVNNSDEQIAVSNNGSNIVVTNNFPEFDGTISFQAIDEAGQSTTLTVIFK